jgi:hypothetical protein
MKTLARTLAVAVALATLAVLPAGAAHAREAEEPSHRADATQAGSSLARVKAAQRHHRWAGRPTRQPPGRVATVS